MQNSVDGHQTARSGEGVQAPLPPECVVFAIPLSKINDIQLESMCRAIKRCRGAHFTDLKIRINGQDEHYQADWFKHMLVIESAGRSTAPLDTVYAMYRDLLDQLGCNGHFGAVAEIKALRSAAGKDSERNSGAAVQNASTTLQTNDQETINHPQG